jgi:hypothetical protein
MYACMYVCIYVLTYVRMYAYEKLSQRMPNFCFGWVQSMLWVAYYVPGVWLNMFQCIECVCKMLRQKWHFWSIINVREYT